MAPLFLQIALIAVSVSGIFMVIKPMYDEIGSIQLETEEYQRALDTAVQANAKMTSLKNDINRYSQQDKYRIELLVPENLAPVRAAYDIEELVSETGMNLTSISVGTVGKINNPVAAPSAAQAAEAFDLEEVGTMNLVSQQLDLSVSGTYEQFKYLLTKLESSARLIDIKTLSFSGEDSDLSTFTLSLVVYGLNSDAPLTTDSN